MKKILFGNVARKEIKKGIDKCVDVVKVSLGKKGKNVLIFNGTTTEIINDGVSIVRQVVVKDNTEKAGIALAKQCAEKTNTEAGDGTTTTMVLLQSLLNELLADTQLMEARELRKLVQEDTKRIVNELKKKTTKVKTKKDIEDIATTSSLNPQIGKMISEIFEALGEDANITINETRHTVLEHKIVEGIKFDTRNRALYSDDMEVYKDVTVFISDEEVDAMKITEKAQVVSKNGDTEMIVVAPKFSKDAIALITQFKMQKNFKVAAVETLDRDFEDLMVFGNKVEKAIITKEDTTLIGGNGDTKEYVENLKKEKEKAESLYDREQLEKRISFLTGGIAEIIVGRPTQVETEEWVLKIEDAVNSARNAFVGGYVKGGGLALKEAGKVAKTDIMKKVSESVYNQICENAEEEVKVTDEVKDSFTTVSQSLINAVSTATSILTTESALIAYEDDK
jgi:chaperonin GroEL